MAKNKPELIHPMPETPLLVDEEGGSSMTDDVVQTYGLARHYFVASAVVALLDYPAESAPSVERSVLSRAIHLLQRQRELIRTE